MHQLIEMTSSNSNNNNNADDALGAVHFANWLQKEERGGKAKEVTNSELFQPAETSQRVDGGVNDD